MQTMNKDEAERCTQAALAALRSGNNHKAQRLIEKSHRMFPTEETAKLLEHLMTSDSDAAATTSSEARPARNENRHPSHTEQESPPTEPAYTQEQYDLCTRVLKEKDYYAVLNVERNASEDVLKRAYKKMALQLHPDKNFAPHSEEAFKKVARVFQRLSDSSKRAIYDRCGDEEDAPAMVRTQYESSGVLSPEDLFTTFFGMEFDHVGRPRVIRRVRRQAATPQQQRAISILQILPVIVLLAISFFGGLFTESNAPEFSLSPFPKFPVQMQSKGHNIRFFVPQSFKREYPEGSFRRHEVERKVELKHFAHLCELEKKEIIQKVHKARREGSSKEVEDLTRRVRMEQTEGCSTYRRLVEPRNPWISR
eukprot:Polyplicarium_translucidae@DN1973_c0_g1_i3.p1